MSQPYNARIALIDYADKAEKLNPRGNSPSMQLLLDYARGLAVFAEGILAGLFSCVLAYLTFKGYGPVAGIAVLIVCMCGLIVLAMANIAPLFAERNEP